jgi:hypothetical protein
MKLLALAFVLAAGVLLRAQPADCVACGGTCMNQGTCPGGCVCVGGPVGAGTCVEAREHDTR